MWPKWRLTTSLTVAITCKTCANASGNPKLVLQHLRAILSSLVCSVDVFLQVQHDVELAKEDKEVGSRRAAFWKKLSENFIERYFYLILFNVYCTEEVAKGDSVFTASFVDYCGSQKTVLELLGTREAGPLSEFNWNWVEHNRKLDHNSNFATLKTITNWLSFAYHWMKYHSNVSDISRCCLVKILIRINRSWLFQIWNGKWFTQVERGIGRFRVCATPIQKLPLSSLSSDSLSNVRILWIRILTGSSASFCNEEFN